MKSVYCLLFLIFTINPLWAQKCYEGEDQFVIPHKGNYFFFINENRKSVSINKLSSEKNISYKEKPCNLINSKVRYSLDSPTDLCVYDKKTSLSVGKLLFRVLNHSAENTITIEIKDEIMVLGEGSFLSGYYVNTCKKKK